MQMEAMAIGMWTLERLKPYEKNPRINDGAVDAVARSIESYGFRQPIVVDTEGVIIVGHTRWKAAKKLGIEKVPVHVVLDAAESLAGPAPSRRSRRSRRCRGRR